MANLNDTAHKLLDVAESYTQLRGFNAFSYKDLQEEVGVKTSTIHYYFPSKQDLALSMTERYVERFQQLLHATAQDNASGLQRLQVLGEAYVSIVAEGKFCMCGMMASDMMSLPDVVNSKLRDFFQLTEAWIAEAIQLGIEQEDIGASVNPAKAAPHLLATLEGGMLIARVQQRPESLAAVIEQALVQLES